MDGLALGRNCSLTHCGCGALMHADSQDVRVSHSNQLMIFSSHNAYWSDGEDNAEL